MGTPNCHGVHKIRSQRADGHGNAGVWHGSGLMAYICATNGRVGLLQRIATARLTTLLAAAFLLKYDEEE